MSRHATVVGAGLAGAEAAWMLAKYGIPTTLYEMKPVRFSPAHKSPLFSELVCSNSLRSDRLENAVGLLKEEMRRLGSLVMEAAELARVPAGGALAVDRECFSGHITEALEKHPLIEIRREEVSDIPEDDAVIIATGPLTSDALAETIAGLPGVDRLSFYDAAAPIVTADSLDMDHVFRASRYGRGDDYLNCPMTKEEYDAFIDALLTAETAPVEGFEETSVFEGCMPIESMAKRGRMVPAFGPMKPVGLVDPNTGRMPYACLQLRQDDAADTLYNLVGFQTRLKFPEQRRVFGLIPGLRNAEYARYGVMHRNTFLNSPGYLSATYECLNRPGLYFAGQMTGVEGYVESASSGMVAGLNAALKLTDQPPCVFPEETAIGSLALYISTPNRHFQPMNITFGLMPPLDKRVRDKKARYQMISERALNRLQGIIEEKQLRH